VTNQELKLGDRKELKKAAGGVAVELYHLERVTTLLDQPAMARVRRQFLGFDLEPDVVESSTDREIDEATPANEPDAGGWSSVPATTASHDWLPPTVSLTSTDGAAVAPISWRLRLGLSTPFAGTKAALHQALEDAVVERDLRNYQRTARWPRLLALPAKDVQDRTLADGSLVWSFAYATDPRAPEGDEHLVLSPGGALAFQRNALRDTDEAVANFGLMADDVLCFLIFAAKFATRIGSVGEVEVTLHLRTRPSERGTLAMFSGSKVDPEQPGRAGRLPRGRGELAGSVRIQPRTTEYVDGLVGVAKRLLDYVANEFELDASVLGRSPNFMVISAPSLVRQIRALGLPCSELPPLSNADRRA
jgi:hypothetical protein